MNPKRTFVFVLAIGIMVPALAFADDLNALQQQILVLIQQVVMLQQELSNLKAINSVPCHTFASDLGVGDAGEDVFNLQVMLEKEGNNLRDEKANKTYGEKTASAVSGFQEKYRSEILTPIGLGYGTGYFGKRTRDKFNSIYGCGAKAPDLTNSRPLYRASVPVTILTPSGGQLIRSPLKITGYINSDGWLAGTNNAGTITLTDSLGRILGNASAVPSASWNKKDMPIPFAATLQFGGSQIDRGVLVFRSSNASAFLAAKDKEFHLAVQLAPAAGGRIAVSSPPAGGQIFAGQNYTLTWRTTSRPSVSIYLLDTAMESLDPTKAVVARVYNVSNSGIYAFALPSGLNGSYRFFITDGSWVGASDVFNVFGASQLPGKPPVVTAMSGPMSLNLNQSGSWHITANDPDGGSLAFNVQWGDGSSGLPQSTGQENGGTGATFAHLYAFPYSYAITFVVTNQKGLETRRSMTVSVK